MVIVEILFVIFFRLRVGEVKCLKHLMFSFMKKCVPTCGYVGISHRKPSSHALTAINKQNKPKQTSSADTNFSISSQRFPLCFWLMVNNPVNVN